MHLGRFAQSFQLSGDGRPALAVEGIHRRMVEDHLGDAVVQLYVKWIAHPATTPVVVRSFARRVRRAHHDPAR
ncbi:hypothetical protein D3C81_2029360 [compost metagenome]